MAVGARAGRRSLFSLASWSSSLEGHHVMSVFGVSQRFLFSSFVLYVVASQPRLSLLITPERCVFAAAWVHLADLSSCARQEADRIPGDLVGFGKLGLPLPKKAVTWQLRQLVSMEHQNLKERRRVHWKDL